MTEEQKQKAISLEEKAAINAAGYKSWEEDQKTNPTQVNPYAYVSGYAAGYLARAPEVERLRKENEELREQVRQLNAGMIHFPTLDRMPTLDLLSREGIIEHVVNIGKKKVLNNL